MGGDAVHDVNHVRVVSVSFCVGASMNEQQVKVPDMNFKPRIVLLTRAC